jgi:hypothetical protein
VAVQSSAARPHGAWCRQITFVAPAATARIHYIPRTSQLVPGATKYNNKNNCNSKHPD